METPNSSPAAGGAPLAPLVVPTLNVSSPASGIAGTSVTLTGTGFTGVTGVTFGGAPASSFSVTSATRITATAPPGAGTVQIVVTTTGGTSNGLGFTYTTATPVVTSLAPPQGPTAGGNTVTLTGSALSGASAVRFGAVGAAFTVVSATQITATAPAGTGTVFVNVTTPGGISAGLVYTYLGTPVLTSVTPSQGSTAGGNTVTLTGSGLTGATAVLFGGTAAPSFTVVSATQITAAVPSGTPGAVPVTVTTPAGTTAGDVYYYFLPQPVLTSAAPGSGPVAGGTVVVLAGSGLVTATAVRFGTTPAPSFTAVSDARVDAVAPAGSAGTVAVTVTTPAGTSGPVGYAYVPVPVLVAVTPDAGPLGGTTVTLTGSALTATTSVLFAGVPAAFSAVSDTTLTAVVPTGAAGAVAVTAVSPGGTTAGVTYTRVPPPGI